MRLFCIHNSSNSYLCRSAIHKLQRSVVDRILGILVGDIPVLSRWHEAALKLVHPLLQFIDREYGCSIAGDKKNAEVSEMLFPSS